MYIPKTTMFTAKKKKGKKKRISSSVYQISPCSQRNNREQSKFKTTMVFTIHTLGVIRTVVWLILVGESTWAPQNCLGLINVFRRGKAPDKILNSYYVQNWKFYKEFSHYIHHQMVAERSTLQILLSSTDNYM